MKRIFLFIIAANLLALLALSTHLVAEQQESAGLIRELQSTDPMLRMSAFEALEKLPGGLNTPGMSGILLDLLDRENQLTVSTLRESHGEAGIGDKYGETYGEYYSKVLNACHERCDRKNPKTAEILVNSAYGPASPFAQQLAKEFGRKILPHLVSKSHSDLSVVRNEGVMMLGTLASFGTDLSSADLGSVRNAVINATGDSERPVREAAVITLGNIGDKRDIDLLVKIADGDAATDVDGRGRISRPVRDEAQRAIAKIRQRNK